MEGTLKRIWSFFLVRFECFSWMKNWLHLKITGKIEMNKYCWAFTLGQDNWLLRAPLEEGGYCPAWQLGVLGSELHRVSQLARGRVWVCAWLCLLLGFSSGSAGKESACYAGDLGLIPGLGRSPGEGKGYPLQYSGLENSMDCIVHGVAKSQTWPSNFHFLFTSKVTALCPKEHLKKILIKICSSQYQESARKANHLNDCDVRKVWDKTCSHWADVDTQTWKDCDAVSGSIKGKALEVFSSTDLHFSTYCRKVIKKKS